jgi:hypothetical protein
MAASLSTFWAGQPRRNQLIIMHGIPVVILIGLLFWDWKALGSLGLIDNTIDADNKLPSKMQRDTPDSTWAHITTTQSSITAQDAIISQGPEANKQLASLQQDIANSEAQLPRESEKADMRELIERLAKEIPKGIGTVELKSVHIDDSIKTATGTNVPRSLTFRVELVGQQDGILKYIDSIEKNQRFMTVNNITITTGGYTSDKAGHRIIPNLHTVHMDIVTYIYNPEKK